MRNAIIAILVFCVGSLKVLAAVPTWSVNPADYSGSMVMVGVISVDGIESIDENDMVAAFVDTEVRGVAHLQYEAAADRYFAYLIIYGNTSGGTLTFKMYDADNDNEVNAISTATFQINGAQGNLGSPFIWSNTMLSAESALLDFSFAESVSVEILGTDVNITMPYVVDITALQATFNISSGATIWVGNVAQVSGVSVNDFSQPVEYKVIAENGSDFTVYTVQVSETVNPVPSDIDVTFGNTNENNALNASFATLTAVDDAADSHVFSLVAGSGDTDNSSFEIIDDQILAKSVFDFEVRSAYTIRVKVADSHDQTFEKPIEITITDVNEAPTLTGASFTVPENSVNGFYLGTLQGVDAEGDSLSYSITSGNELGGFSLESATGVLLVADQKKLDFETNPSFTLMVQVSDGELTDQATVTINLTDVEEQVNQAPTIANQTFTVEENRVVGFVIGIIAANDPDGDALTYTIDGGSSTFSLHASTGNLTVVDAAALDFETTSQFTLTVTVSDGSLSASAMVTINLTDVDESVNQAPQISSQVFSLAENNAVGLEVGTVNAGDPDGDAITYSLSGGDNAFAIDASTGLLTAAVIVDNEVNSQFILSVTVSDGSLTASATIVVNVIDVDDSINSAPILTDKTFSLPDNSVNGFYLGTLQGVDAEGDSLSYSITSGNELGGFSLESATGVLLVADQSQLDFETNPSFTLMIQVSDGNLTDDATITINLTDVEEQVNQAPTIANQTFTVEENRVVGFVIGTIAANDPDGDALVYSLSSSSVFTIDPATGTLIVADPLALDYETTRQFILVVTVSDGELTSQAIITINIMDLDDNVLGLKQEVNIVAYPNPTVDVLNIKSDLDIKMVKCYNLNGKLVLTSFDQTLEVAHISSGQYILHVFYNESTEILKFIKQ